MDRRWAYPALSLVGIAAALLVWIWWRGSNAVALPKDRNLAVLAPEIAGGDDGFASFGLGFVDLLSSRLQRHADTPGFQTASFTDGIDEKVRSAGDARKLLGANVALLPTLEQRPDVLRARLDLFDTARERVITSRTIEAPASQPFVFLDRTYRDAAAMLGLAADGKDAQSECGIRGAGTLRFYLQGIGRNRAAETEDGLRKAIEDLELACRTEPDAAVTRAALAAAQLRAYTLSSKAEWLTQAEASARQAVALDGARPEPHRALGLVLFSAKKTDESLMELTRAVDLDPTDDFLCYRLGRTYNRAGQPDKERDVYQAASARRPHCWQPYWWLGTWHFRQGNVAESVRAYEEMIRRSPGLYKGYSSLGGLLVLQGDYGKAIETLRHSVELRPTRVAFDNLGTAYFHTGRFQEAIDAYNQSFQFGFADYGSWLNLGDAYFWLRNRKDQARDAYAQAVRLGNDEMLERAHDGRAADVMIPAYLATVYPKLGHPDSARIYLGQALRADSTNPMVMYCAALTHWQLQEREPAMVWLEKSVQGGYPIAWLRDSPVFNEWRQLPGFRALVEKEPPEPQAASRNRGEGR